MAHFSLSNDIPELPSYLFEADLQVSISSPVSFTAIPKNDRSVRIDWDKDNNTTSTSTNPVYAQIYRSTNLRDWELVSTVEYPVIAYTDTSDLKVGKVYYYRVRFVRKDGYEAISRTSSYTLPIAVRIVTAPGVEPRDIYSNKFFQYLLKGLPGRRIYDSTEAAFFSADKHYWQTHSQQTEGFTVYSNGEKVHNEDTDSTKITTKRAIDFVLDKKHSTLQIQTDSGISGEDTHLNQYLIHTFLWGYAQQFMVLYEKYFQIVADKYIDFEQNFSKGFKPAVATTKLSDFASMYKGFGELMGLKPPKAEKVSQGLKRYRDLLKSVNSNIENIGKVRAIYDSCFDVLGITTETLFEHKNFHWFKDDRELKLYMMPEASDPINCYVNGSTGAGNMKYTALDDRYSLFVEYYNRPYINGDTVINSGQVGWLQVLGSGADNPYTYLFRAYVSDGVTTALNLKHLFESNSLAASLLTPTISDGGVGSGVILGYTPPTPLVRRSFYLGWEDTEINLNNRKYTLSDISDTTSTGTDYCHYSCILSELDPTSHISPGEAMTGDPVGNDLEAVLEASEVVISRDDNGDGVGWFNDSNESCLIYKNKSVLFRMDLTKSRMSWLKKAVLKLYVKRNVNAGYVRLYRMKKPYNDIDVCWNYRSKEDINSGYYWNGSDYVEIDVGNSSTWKDYVTKDWEEDGATGNKDRVLLGEFYIPRITSAQWVELDITHILKNIYKYETSRLDADTNSYNILRTGFMLSAEGFDNRSAVVFAGHTDSTYRPQIEWEVMARGYFSTDPNTTTYFYVDGTTRYGRLLVLQSDKEPLSYDKLVHEKIRNQDIHFSEDTTLKLSSIPGDFEVGSKLYGQTSGAVGTISSIGNTSIFISVSLKRFESGETVQLLEDPTITATITSINYSGNKYLEISRYPINSYDIVVHHTGITTAPASPPDEYPSYSEWSEEGSGIEPVFLSSSSGNRNIFASQDVDNPKKIYLNSSDSIADIGDVIVTYKYKYDFQFLGRAITNNKGITKLEGCSRLGSHLYSESDNDWKYKSELMFPMPSSGELVDISGLTTANDYSDHNLAIIANNVSNVRRYNAEIDTFKYGMREKPYRFNQLYHSFLKRT